MKKKYSVLGIVFILLLGGVSSTTAFQLKTNKIKESTDSETKTDEELEKIHFSDSFKDASTLNIRGIIQDEKLSNYKDKAVKTKQISFVPSKCSIRQMDLGYVYLDLDGLEPSGSPGQPMLPMETFTIELPKNVKVIDVKMANVNYREIKNRVRVMPTPEPVFWFEDDYAFEDLVDRTMPSLEVYSSDNFFPGDILSYHVGNTNEKKLVLIQVYPIQNTPRNGKTILITDGEIKVFYENQEEIIYTSSSASSYVNLVITPPSLFSQAQELKNFHDSQGTLTDVVKTTWIDENYPEADDPPYDGYRDASLKELISLWRYDYSLAKKIIAYLNDTAEHTNLKYVTLLGNARLVPPSYYSKLSWTPTDFFYSSPDYDLVPNYFVGRLPVNDVEEAAHVINKIKNWNGTTDLFRNITLSGGRSFGTPFFVGGAYYHRFS